MLFLRALRFLLHQKNAVLRPLVLNLNLLMRFA
jgi:hypothetical protein